MAAPQPAPGSLRETAFARIWLNLVLWSLLGVLPFVYHNLATALGLYLRDELVLFRPATSAWLAFSVVQAASKAPIAYLYPLRWPLAAFELLGFGAGLAGAVALGIGIRAPDDPVRLVWVALIATWIVVGTVYQLSPNTPTGRETSLGRRVYCALMAFMLPSLPYLFAVLLLPAA